MRLMPFPRARWEGKEGKGGELPAPRPCPWAVSGLPIPHPLSPSPSQCPICHPQWARPQDFEPGMARGQGGFSAFLGFIVLLWNFGNPVSRPCGTRAGAALWLLRHPMGHAVGYPSGEALPYAAAFKAPSWRFPGDALARDLAATLPNCVKGPCDPSPAQPGCPDGSGSFGKVK
jgi:hypothetical protein